MKSLIILILSVAIITGFNSCKKEERPTTGTIVVIFSGTPSAGYGETVTLNFAKDLYHLDQRIFSFNKTSNKPHGEMTISDVEPMEWYYLEHISSLGMPTEIKGIVKVEAGKTATINVQF
ncbi:MAG: hypothetical protein ACKVQB_03580 [Bacteroidia bacterium]